MKRVLLVTLQGDNLGNRLQNYALQEVLKSMDCEVYTPYYRLKEFDTKTKKFKFYIKAKLGRYGIAKYRSQYIRSQRIKAFSKFDSTYINNMFLVNYTDVLGKEWSFYDYAITGSDQVWHGWSENPDELRYFYLEFIDKFKRISYAPSFGFDEFPVDSIETHKNGLNGIEHLSCREMKGIELISKLTGKKAKYVLDPTLLLRKEDWVKIEKRPKWYDGNKYILTYYLGENLYKTEIEKFAIENNLKVVNVYDRESLKASLIVPDEFVWLVRNAEYICTDSFHASVFSYIFNKRFLAYKRQEEGMEKMFDRIETLLNILGIHDRIYKGDLNSIVTPYETNDISILREDSISFLRNSLK